MRGVNMIVKCPNCKSDLEAPDDATGRHLLCSICNTKFQIEDQTITKVLEDRNNKNWCSKFLEHFRKSPLSIKFITIFLLLITILESIPKCKPSALGIFECILLIPLILRKEKAWRVLLIFVYLAFGAAGLFVVFYFRSGQIENLLISMEITAIYVPLFVALRKDSVVSWACK